MVRNGAEWSKAAVFGALWGINPQQLTEEKLLRKLVIDVCLDSEPRVGVRVCIEKDYFVVIRL